MAEKNITTWEEFKTALKEDITENTTYNIKNDLDAANDILTNSIICKSSRNKIFKGNGYKINGITAYGNVIVFDSNLTTDHDFRFYGIKFTNFMVESGGFLSLCRSSYHASFSEYSDLFVNCFFNGVCKNFTYAVETDRISYFTKCSFNVRCERFAGERCSFDSCYIVITPLQNTCNFSSNTTLINSYVEGTIKKDFSSSSYLTPKFSGNNVFNCKVIVTNYSASTTYQTYNSSAPVLINKDRLLQNDGVTPIANVASATNIYFLTDEQMKNKEYIQQNTTFPLYA